MEWPDELRSVMIMQARKRLGMGQRDMAELLMSSTATVCQWEIGRRIPRGPTWKLFLLMMEKEGITFDKQSLLIDYKVSPKKDKASTARRNPYYVKPVKTGKRRPLIGWSTPEEVKEA